MSGLRDITPDKRIILVGIAGIIILYIVINSTITLRNVIMLGFIIAIYFLIKDKNLYKIRNTFMNFVENLLPPKDNNDTLLNNITQIIPVAGDLESVRIEYIDRLKQYINSGNEPEFASTLILKINGYFYDAYRHINTVLTSPYPQNSIISLLDAKKHLLDGLATFIFIPERKIETDKLQANIITAFDNVITALADKVNLNTDTAGYTGGFISYPNEPEPYNLYRSH